MAGRAGAILSSLSFAAGQLLRRNAADNAFEAFTPKYAYALATFYADATPSATTTNTDVYNTDIAANTLAANGDHISARYEGVTATANVKALRVKFAGTTFFDTDDVNLAEDFLLTVEITRVSNSIARCTATFIGDSYQKTQRSTISSGIDFTTQESLTLILYAETTTTDITMKSGIVSVIFAP